MVLKIGYMFIVDDVDKFNSLLMILFEVSVNLILLLEIKNILIRKKRFYEKFFLR